jgi:hypothetical protein
MHHVMAFPADHIDPHKFRHGLAVYVFPDLMSIELFHARTHNTTVVAGFNQVSTKGGPTLLSHPVRCTQIFEMQRFGY